MELIELNAKPREKSGKGAARKLRALDAIPAIVYGAKMDSAMLSLEAADFDKIIRDNGTTGLFFNLKIEGAGKDRVVMLKDVQMDTFGLKYLHVDLHEIDMDATVTVTIPVETVGECRGVAEGGMLQIIRRELDVVCKPADTPSSIEIDITNLEIGDSVHIEDVDLGDSIEIPHEVDFTIVTIVPPTAETEEVEADELEEGMEEEAGAGEEEAPAEAEE